MILGDPHYASTQRIRLWKILDRCRGISYDKLGSFDAAIDDFSKVLDLEPSNVNAFFNRGSAYDSKGSFELAVSDYMHALDLDTNGASTGDQPEAQ